MGRAPSFHFPIRYVAVCIQSALPSVVSRPFRRVSKQGDVTVRLFRLQSRRFVEKDRISNPLWSSPMEWIAASPVFTIGSVSDH